MSTAPDNRSGAYLVLPVPTPVTRIEGRLPFDFGNRVSLGSLVWLLPIHD